MQAKRVSWLIRWWVLASIVIGAILVPTNSAFARNITFKPVYSTSDDAPVPLPMTLCIDKPDGTLLICHTYTESSELTNGFSIPDWQDFTSYSLRFTIDGYYTLDRFARADFRSTYTNSILFERPLSVVSTLGVQPTEAVDNQQVTLTGTAMLAGGANTLATLAPSLPDDFVATDIEFNCTNSSSGDSCPNTTPPASVDGISYTRSVAGRAYWDMRITGQFSADAESGSKTFGLCTPLDGENICKTTSLTFTNSVPPATPTPEPTATPEPTNTPTPEPTATATPSPTSTPEPTTTPTATPTSEPTVTPTSTPTSEPTATSTPEPTPTSGPANTPTPTAEQTATSTFEPLPTATHEPTMAPTVEPTAEPTMPPTQETTPGSTATAPPTTSPTPEPRPTQVTEPEQTATRRIAVTTADGGAFPPGAQLCISGNGTSQCQPLFPELAVTMSIVPVSAGEVTVTLTDLPNGSYSVSLIDMAPYADIEFSLSVDTSSPDVTMTPVTIPYPGDAAATPVLPDPHPAQTPAPPATNPNPDANDGVSDRPAPVGAGGGTGNHHGDGTGGNGAGALVTTLPNTGQHHGHGSSAAPYTLLALVAGAVGCVALAIWHVRRMT